MTLDPNNFQQMLGNTKASIYYDSGNVSSGSFNMTLLPGLI